MLTQAFVLGVNHLLRADGRARAMLRPFAGRTARLIAPPLSVAVAVNDDGTISEAAAERVDVEITLPAHAPFSAIAGKQAILRQAKVAGSAEFADAIGALARELRWDYEEDLSRAVGDVAAHRIGQTLRRLASWQRAAAASFAANLVEYYRDEKRMIAPRGSIAEFSSAVDTLRDDVARLEKRIERLKRRRAQAD